MSKFDLTNVKLFKYSPNPEVLTGEIETLTNYSQRKKNLELRKKMFEDKDDEQSIKELERLEQLYTLGSVNFDSVIIIDFGNNLKSVLTSLVYTDVKKMYCSLLLISGLMRVYSMKTRLKNFITPQ